MSRIRFCMGVFTPDLGFGRGASYWEIEDGWAIRQVDVFEDYGAWLSSGCHDYDSVLALGDCMLCNQPMIIDEYEFEVLGEDLLSAKFGEDWREELEEMFKDNVEIAKEQFEEIWAEAMRRCVDKA